MIAEKAKTVSKVPEAPFVLTTKTVILTKVVGGGWDISIRGPVTQIDINHLSRRIRVEYARIKRRSRLRKLGAVNEHKELVNAE